MSTWGEIITALRAVREARRLSARSVARAIGAAATSVSVWERGSHIPLVTSVIDWAHELGYELVLQRVACTSARCAYCRCDPAQCAADDTGGYCADVACGSCLHGCPADACNPGGQMETEKTGDDR
ncbi:MAG TPA: helix-turn-helix transcriptional regulator [Kutzneria sp.]|jgi:hypothetical protein|nr:helix-turn-helix transcriptional regulator [Kutzneria sp.]